MPSSPHHYPVPADTDFTCERIFLLPKATGHRFTAAGRLPCWLSAPPRRAQALTRQFLSLHNARTAGQRTWLGQIPVLDS